MGAQVAGRRSQAAVRERPYGRAGRIPQFASRKTMPHWPI